jgi:glutamyl-tRNA synthetase
VPWHRSCRPASEVLSQVPELVDFLFLETPPVDDAAWAKTMDTNAGAVPVLDGCIAAYGDAPWDAESLKGAVTAVGEANG